MNHEFNSHEYVSATVEGSPIDVERGKPFPFFIKLRLADGVHINFEPPVSIVSLDRKVALSFKALPESEGYLDCSKPLEVEGELRDHEVGEHELHFVVSYMYCSDEGKWCRFGKDSMSVTLRIRK
jgi:hypothetical protein